MFGKPEWFRPKRLGWGLTPITWQGWVYTLAWLLAIVVPFLILVLRHQPAEAVVWMALMIGALIYDTWHILRAMRGPDSHSRAARTSPNRDENVLYIADSQPGPVATRNYKLHVRG